MRVLLLGGTGFLGRRCIQTLLAHQHVLTLHVRNLEKLRSLVSSEVLDAINSVVVGDAVDTAQIARTLRDNNIEAVVDIAGEHVAPWKEPVFPKIAKAVCDAAVTVGKERGRSLRLWVVVGMSVLEYPGTGYLLDDYVPVPGAAAAHMGVRDVVEANPTEDLRWSLLGVAQMVPSNPAFAPFTPPPRRPNKEGVFGLLDAPQPHNLMLKATAPPAWENTWLLKIPWIGPYLNLFVIVLWQYQTKYEDVADFLAEDLKSGSEEWVGLKVGMKEKGKLKTA